MTSPAPGQIETVPRLLPNWLHQIQGPLTRELILAPSKQGLGMLPNRLQPDALATTTCGYCSTGCGLTVHLRDGMPCGLSPSTDYPVNLGKACPKGWEALSVLDAPDRATVPLLRNERGQLVPVDWSRAMAEFVGRLKSIQQRHGPESVAFLSTGQIATEEMAFLGALAKFGMGMRHGDGNTRQCMASAVVAYKQAFGYDAPPYTYEDFEESDVLVFTGSNPCLAHPIMWERVMANGRDPEIIVIDPRMTETAMAATQHLAIKPKSDQTLFYGLARLLIERGWINERFIETSTRDFDRFADFVQAFDLSRVVEETGLNAIQIERLASTIHERDRTSFWWTMGVNQSHQGVRTAQAIINLALITGNIGRPGTGANSITGQCNAMGSRLFSNTTSLFAGRDFTNEQHRQRTADILGIDVERIPTEASWAYSEIMEGILRGKIKAIWVIATNPSHSWINQHLTDDLFDRLEFLAVQDMYHSTETARQADLILPAAAWGEKEGTFINSERRLGVMKKVSQAPGQALSDFQIFRLIATAWGCGDMFRRWTSPAAVFDILKECSEGTPCDITGIRDYQHIEAQGGIQWPWTREDQNENSQPATHRRLFKDGRFYHADQRARFLFEEPRPLPERPNATYPFLLLTGRGSASQWHTQTRTSKSAVLRKLYPERPFVEVNPADGRALGLRQNDWVTVESQRGRMQAMAFLTPSVAAGQVFIPMHDAATNRLTDAVFDPYSRQPAYKACAVRIVKGRG